MYTKPRRDTGFAAVLVWAVRAGTMASSSGSASMVPAPRRNARRGICFLVTNLISDRFRLLHDDTSAGECGERREHFRAVTARIDSSPYSGNLALGVHQKCVTGRDLVTKQTGQRSVTP